MKKYFGNKEYKLSKVEYWKKWESFDFLIELYKAEKLLLKLQSENLTSLDRSKKFHALLVDEIDNIEGGNKNDLCQIWQWFNPKSMWDELVKNEESEIGIRVFKITNKWYLSEYKKR